MLGIDRMHQEGFRGDGLLVAIFDSGFRNYTNLPAFSHLIDREGIIQTFDYTKNSVSVENNFDHGLRVLSVLGADAEMIGAVPQANYILAITENEVSEYRIEEYNWLFAAEMADSAGVDVINTSLGYSVFDDESMSYTQDQMDGETTVISRAASIAASKGIVLVASAGNEGNNAWGTITAPADSEHLLAVGAVNNLADLANFSSTGPSADGRIKPDVVAQGVNTQLTNSQGTVTFQNGTSFSAPLVAGLAAGLMEAFP